MSVDFASLEYDSPRGSGQIGIADASPNGILLFPKGYPTSGKIRLLIPKTSSTDRYIHYTTPDATAKIRMPSRETKLDRFELFNREKDAFFRILDSLLGHETYEQKFVAIHEGKVIAVDDSKRELARKVYSEYGYIPIYMGKVERERTVGEMSSPERV